MFDPGPEFAGRVLWFDALVGNVDRSWRNSNMLLWHRRPYLIDHGATLTFHHGWSGPPTAEALAERAARPYDAADHVLLGAAPDVDAADGALAPLVTSGLLTAAAAAVPDEWLADEPGFGSADAVRAAYTAALTARLDARHAWLPRCARPSRPGPGGWSGRRPGRRGWAGEADAPLRVRGAAGRAAARAR
ncbi:hypothetical protein ACFQV8_26730 [Pseudonocardia benzenivorans]